MSTINALLDAAAKKTGSDYKTAELLGKPRQEISNWRHGSKNAQPEDHALIAAIAGLDAEEALVRAVLAKHADTPKGEKLMTALGNALRRTGVAASWLFLASVGLATTSGQSEAQTTSRVNSDNVHYVKLLKRNRLPQSPKRMEPCRSLDRRAAWTTNAWSRSWDRFDPSSKSGALEPVQVWAATSL